MSLPDTLPTVDRRRLLRWLAAGPVALSLACRGKLAFAGDATLEVLHAPRQLSLLNLHTSEKLEVRYFDNGAYVPGALSRLNQVLRDHRSGETGDIDPRLFDQLHALAECAGCAPHYQVISGYRSPASNAQLRASSKGVAKHSLHMEGRAIDVRLPGTACNRLRDFALGMQAGGVGYYAKSNFVHLDTGRVRSWAG
jgi:uncharacterized protein YcbK (DUF882 family)